MKAGRPFLCAGGAKFDAVVKIAVQHAIVSVEGSVAQIASFVEELEHQQRTMPSIQLVLVGGTQLPPALAHQIQSATEGCRIIGTYGSTEANGATAKYNESDEASDAGRILPGVTLQIVNDDDQEQPDGQVWLTKILATQRQHS